MSESEAASTGSDLEALKALQEDTRELERIRRLLDQFNVFETIGFVDQELMHSQFLASLLDPKQNHDLGEAFLRKLLAEASLTIFLDLGDENLGKTLVRREWQNVDMLLTNENLRLALIIENKIWSSEHSDQLNWYYRIVSGNYPGWRVVGIYLTPHGDAPSHEKYIALSYETVCKILDEILEGRGSAMSADVRLSIEHYVQMVRRRILGDPEIVEWCQEIYLKHKRAFDLIYKHRPDIQAQIRPIVEDLIRQHPELKPDASRKDNIKFVVEEWDNAPALLTSTGYTPSGHILIFEVWNNLDSLDVHLFMGPGPEATRQRLLEMVRANPEVFVEPRSVNTKWLPIFSRHLLRQEAYEDLDEKKREQEIHKQWDEFLNKDLSRIETALKGEKWMWKSTETEGST